MDILVQLPIFNDDELMNLSQNNSQNDITIFYQRIDAELIEKKNWTSNLINYIDENYTNPNLSLKEVAFELGKNEKAISKYLKETYLLSFKQYLNNVRLEKATELIKEELNSFKEIAYLVGYASSNHFTRAFKLRYNITPTEYKLSEIDV